MKTLIEHKGRNLFKGISLYEAVESTDAFERHYRLNEIMNTTNVKSEGKDELYCEFWRCLTCNEGSIPAGSKYCSECGRKIDKVFGRDYAVKEDNK